MHMQACAVRNIVVVDDDERVLATWQRGFDRLQRTVHVATDPLVARSLVKTECPELVVVDLRLGAGSGIDLIRDLRRDHPHLRIALISGWLSLSVAMAAIQAGADMFLAKPVLARDVVHYVETGTVPDIEIDETPSLARVEYEHIQRVLADSNNNISEAARRLRMFRQSLARKLKKTVPPT